MGNEFDLTAVEIFEEFLGYPKPVVGFDTVPDPLRYRANGRAPTVALVTGSVSLTEPPVSRRRRKKVDAGP